MSLATNAQLLQPMLNELRVGRESREEEVVKRGELGMLLATQWLITCGLFVQGLGRWSCQGSSAVCLAVMLTVEVKQCCCVRLVLDMPPAPVVVCPLAVDGQSGSARGRQPGHTLCCIA
jgi:hypothetical protein